MESSVCCFAILTRLSSWKEPSSLLLLGFPCVLNEEKWLGVLKRWFWSLNG